MKLSSVHQVKPTYLSIDASSNSVSQRPLKPSQSSFTPTSHSFTLKSSQSPLSTKQQSQIQQKSASSQSFGMIGGTTKSKKSSSTHRSSSSSSSKRNTRIQSVQYSTIDESRSQQCQQQQNQQQKSVSFTMKNSDQSKYFDTSMNFNGTMKSNSSTSTCGNITKKHGVTMNGNYNLNGMITKNNKQSENSLLIVQRESQEKKQVVHRSDNERSCDDYCAMDLQFSNTAAKLSNAARLREQRLAEKENSILELQTSFQKKVEQIDSMILKANNHSDNLLRRSGAFNNIGSSQQQNLLKDVQNNQVNSEIRGFNSSVSPISNSIHSVGFASKSAQIIRAEPNKNMQLQIPSIIGGVRKSEVPESYRSTTEPSELSFCHGNNVGRNASPWNCSFQSNESVHIAEKPVTLGLSTGLLQAQQNQQNRGRIPSPPHPRKSVNNLNSSYDRQKQGIPIILMSSSEQLGEQRQKEKEVNLSFIEHEISLKEQLLIQKKEQLQLLESSIVEKKEFIRKYTQSYEHLREDAMQVKSELKEERVLLEKVKEDRIKESELLRVCRTEFTCLSGRVSDLKLQESAYAQDLTETESKLKAMQVRFAESQKILAESEARREESSRNLTEQMNQIDSRYAQMTALASHVQLEKQRVLEIEADAKRMNEGAIAVREEYVQKEKGFVKREQEIRRMEIYVEMERANLEEKKLKVKDDADSLSQQIAAYESNLKVFTSQKEEQQYQIDALRKDLKQKEESLIGRERAVSLREDVLKQSEQICNDMELKIQGMHLQEEIWMKKQSQVESQSHHLQLQHNNQQQQQTSHVFRKIQQSTNQNQQVPTALPGGAMVIPAINNTHRRQMSCGGNMDMKNEQLQESPSFYRKVPESQMQQSSNGTKMTAQLMRQSLFPPSTLKLNVPALNISRNQSGQPVSTEPSRNNQFHN